MHLASRGTRVSLDSSPAPPISVACSVVGRYNSFLVSPGSNVHGRLTQPLNKLLGRRGTIFFACVFSSASCLAQAFSKDWKMMVGFRIILGLGFGPKSATIPIYASECAPANIRGALVMFWQFFTAFGIMCGYICGAAFRSVLDGTNASCHQPEVHPLSPSSLSPAMQANLLTLHCVSVGLAIA